MGLQDEAKVAVEELEQEKTRQAAEKARGIWGAALSRIQEVMPDESFELVADEQFTPYRYGLSGGVFFYFEAPIWLGELLFFIGLHNERLATYTSYVDLNGRDKNKAPGWLPNNTPCFYYIRQLVGGGETTMRPHQYFVSTLDELTKAEALRVIAVAGVPNKRTLEELRKRYPTP